ncbi:hypothetical protein IWZ01DRAFT_272334 [Phyllosticta capitalensis]
MEQRSLFAKSVGIISIFIVGAAVTSPSFSVGTLAPHVNPTSTPLPLNPRTIFACAARVSIAICVSSFCLQASRLPSSRASTSASSRLQIRSSTSPQEIPRRPTHLLLLLLLLKRRSAGSEDATNHGSQVQTSFHSRSMYCASAG